MGSPIPHAANPVVYPDSASIWCSPMTGYVSLISFGRRGIRRTQQVANYRTPKSGFWIFHDPSKPPVMLPGQQSRATDVTFSRNGRFLASASRDGIVRLWELGRPGTPPVHLRGHEGRFDRWHFQGMAAAWFPEVMITPFVSGIFGISALRRSRLRRIEIAWNPWHFRLTAPTWLRAARIGRSESGTLQSEVELRGSQRKYCQVLDFPRRHRLAGSDQTIRGAWNPRDRIQIQFGLEIPTAFNRFRSRQRARR